MNTSSVYIHSVSALNSSGTSSALREGSSVFVKVLSQQGNGRYVVSFAGNQFSVASNIPLKLGAVFKATVLLQNGKISLVPQKTEDTSSSFLKSFLNQNNSNIFAPISDSQLSSYLMNLGFVPDTLTLRLFQQMQQLGVRIDPERIQKARLAALKFPGKEKEAAEIALILEEKGIESTEEAVEFFLSEDSHHQKENNDKSKEKKLHTKIEQKIDDQVVLDELSSNVFSESSLLYQNNSKGGLLTLFNHLKNAEDSNIHWVSLPFKMENLHSEELSWHGMIRLCLDIHKNATKKMIISANRKGQRYIIVVYLNPDKSIQKVVFSIDPVPSMGISKTQQFLASLLAQEQKVEINWMDFNDVTPYDSENLPLVFAEGHA